MKRSIVCAAVAASLILAAGWASPAHGAVILLEASLDGGQEVPNPVATAASGEAIMSWNTDTNMFNLSLIIEGILKSDLIDVGPNNAAAHIHLGAPGTNGTILFDIAKAADFVESAGALIVTLEGVIDNDANTPDLGDDGPNEAALLSGNTYINVHTQAFPGGEIRGQLIPEPVSISAFVVAAGLIARRRRR